MTTIEATIEDLRSHVRSPTGESHPLVIKRPNILLQLDWDEQAVAHFPDDLTFSLTVRGCVQQLAQRGDAHQDGRVRVAFHWDAEGDSRPPSGTG